MLARYVSCVYCTSSSSYVMLSMLAEPAVPTVQPCSCVNNCANFASYVLLFKRRSVLPHKSYDHEMFSWARLRDTIC